MNKSFSEVLKQVQKANEYDYNSMIKGFRNEERKEKLKRERCDVIKKMNTQWKENQARYNEIKEKRQSEYQEKLEQDLAEKALRLDKLSNKKKSDGEMSRSQMKLDASNSKRKANEKVEENYRQIEQERRSLARSLTSKSKSANFSGSLD